MLEALGGGVFASPTHLDTTQGELEPSNNPLDVAISGDGYFQVSNGQQNNLTRDGRLVINHKGHAALANNENYELLDTKGKPIALNPRAMSTLIAKDGEISQDNQPIARIGLYDVADKRDMTKLGGTMLTVADPRKLRPAANASIQSQFIERANVEPSSELSALMDAQRQLEANANMIRYQDQMLSKLCNEVGKIS